MLYKRGDIWWIKFKVKGEPIRQSAGTTSKREAEEVERALRNQVARELHAGRTGKPVERTYAEALEKWLESGAPKSMLSHARNTRPYMDPIPLHLAIPAAHNMKSAMLKKGLSVMTINRRLAVVQRILNMAYKEWEWLSEPLGTKIKKFSEKGMEREFYLTREEVDQVIEQVKNPEARKVILLAAYTGLRRGELLGLKQANWQQPYIIMKAKTKGKKPRTIPVIEEFWPYMKLPFKLSMSQLRDQFEAAREAIGRPDIRYHDMRHTYASWLAKNPNVPLTMLRDLLGHSNISVTSKYSHLRGDTMDVVSSAIGERKH
jgi:integrase